VHHHHLAARPPDFDAHHSPREAITRPVDCTVQTSARLIRLLRCVLHPAIRITAVAICIIRLVECIV
jgi:hypothetical protein